MNVNEFARKVRAPFSLEETFRFLNDFQRDFSQYTEPPECWDSLTQNEIRLHCVRLLGKAYGNWRNRGATAYYTLQARDELLHATYLTLVSKTIILSGVKNPEGYLFTILRNSMGELIADYRPAPAINLSKNLAGSLMPTAFRRNGKDRLSGQTGVRINDGSSLHRAFTVLDECCESEQDRDILHEWFKPFIVALAESRPAPCLPTRDGVIASRLGLTEATVEETRIRVGNAYLLRLNAERRRKHQQLIRVSLCA